MSERELGEMAVFCFTSEFHGDSELEEALGFIWFWGFYFEVIKFSFKKGTLVKV